MKKKQLKKKNKEDLGMPDTLRDSCVIHYEPGHVPLVEILRRGNACS